MKNLFIKKYFACAIALSLLFLNHVNVFSQAISISYPSSMNFKVGESIQPLFPTVTGGPAVLIGQTTTVGTGADFFQPLGTAVDAEGNVYVADGGNNRIRKITPAGIISTFAGSGVAGSTNGVGTAASFRHPSALAIDVSGNIFVSDQQNHMIRKITPSGVVTTFAGTGSAGSTNGVASSASFSSPIGLAFDASGNLYVADYGNHRIRVISGNMVGIFAGNGIAGKANGSLLSASFNNPMGLAIDALGIMYVADRGNFLIRAINPSGIVSTLAGTGLAGSNNGVGTLASFNRPNGVAVDAFRNVFVADDNNNVIRKINSEGLVTTLAGRVGVAGSVDGVGSSAGFNGPYAISIDNKNNLYVPDISSWTIRKIVSSPYSITPKLPSGLTFDEGTGVISGMPDAEAAMTTYTVKAYSLTQVSNSFSLNISVSKNSSIPIGLTRDQNYVIANSPRVEGLTTTSLINAVSSDVLKIQGDVKYIDGLGREIQSVQIQGSPSFRDVVLPKAYDIQGREDKKYLPYVSSLALSNGSFKPAAIADQNIFYTDPVGAGATGVTQIPDNTAFSKTVFEASLLNRVLEQGASGSVWQPGSTRTPTGGRTSVISYETNIANEVKLWVVSPTGASTNVFYQPEKLYKTIIMDENWTSGKTGTVEEFKDFDGRLVLKKVWETESVSLSTYYVYDYFGNLRYVIPPAVLTTAFTEAMTDAPFDQFIYAYHYDGRKRLIEKKLPGKGWEFFLYNKLDQIVGSQDALQREKSPQQWTVTKYDAVGRGVLTGIYSHPGSPGNTSYREFFQGIVNAETVLWEERVSTGNGYSGLSIPQNDIGTTLTVNYYDNYSVPGLPAIAPYNLAGNYSKMLNGLPTVSRINVLGTNDMLWLVNYYDDEGRLVRNIKQHYKNASNSVNNYDDILYEYNFQGELLSSVRRHYVNGTEQLYVGNRFVYDHRGRLKDTYQKIGDDATTTNSEVLLSRQNYNELGQLRNKQLFSVNKGVDFAQTTVFDYNARGWLTNQSSALFNESLKYEENIPGNTPQYNGNISRQEWSAGKYYNYTYDPLNRLKSGVSGDKNDEKSIVYDAMGNIQGLQRLSGSILTDQLKYTYVGNRLSSVLDSNSNTSSLYQLPGTTNYNYDDNGNMVSRINAGNFDNNITSITYNYLNLPKSMVIDGKSISYAYDATGSKLRKLVGSAINNEYISGIQYEGGILKSVQTIEGRIVKNSATNYSYEFVLNDHLGNGRVYFDINGGVARKIQETDYYPFGLAIQKSLVGTENKYQYNGKEKQDEEKMYDYGARFYDPVIGRWNVVDPLAEMFDPLSPYNYGMNNPILMIDPDGNAPEDSSNGNINEDRFSNKPLHIASTYVGPGGKVIKHINDNDNSIYQVNDPSKWDGTKKGLNKIGTEIDGVDYNNLVGQQLDPLLYNQNPIQLNEVQVEGKSQNIWPHLIGPGLVELGRRYKVLKPVGALGSKQGSSIASYTLSKLLPQRFTKVLGKKLGTKVATKIGTNTIGRALGRFVPGLGWVITYYDVGTTSFELGQEYGPSKWYGSDDTKWFK